MRNKIGFSVMVAGISLTTGVILMGAFNISLSAGLWATGFVLYILGAVVWGGSAK